MIAVKVRKIGEGLGVELPQAALDRLKVDEGATLVLSEASDGWHLAPADPEFDRQMALAEEIMREDRDILQALAQ
jgi:putative addiction module antidote